MKHSLLIPLLSLILLLAHGVPASALSISFTVDPTYTTSDSFSVTEGGTYAVDVNLTGLTGSDIVSAFDLDILYNSGLLSLTDVVYTELLGYVDFGEAILTENLSTPGLIDFSIVSLLGDATLQDYQDFSGGTITLATLYFSGLSSGTTALAFDWYEGQDVKGANAEIIAGYVPEPGTMLLVGTGISLLAAGGWRRRKNEEGGKEDTE